MTAFHLACAGLVLCGVNLYLRRQEQSSKEKWKIRTVPFFAIVSVIPLSLQILSNEVSILNASVVVAVVGVDVLLHGTAYAAIFDR